MLSNFQSAELKGRIVSYIFLRTKDFSIDTVRPKKTKFAFQEKKFQRSGITTDRRGVSR